MANNSKFISNTAIESYAQNLLFQYDETLVLGEPRAVPIEEIVSFHYKITLEYRTIKQHGEVLGCTVFSDGFLPIFIPEEKRYTLIPMQANTIIIDENLINGGNEGRIRFTIAHELGHWLIHKDIFCGTNNAAASVAKTSLQNDYRLEIQADIFASSILLPKNQVKKAFFENNNIAYLARKFEVSKQTMEIFLRNRNLISR